VRERASEKHVIVGKFREMLRNADFEIEISRVDTLSKKINFGEEIFAG
jgi:hypothetical protein